MSIGWLRRRLGADERIDALAKHLGELGGQIVALEQRVLIAERHAREAALADVAGQRRIAALSRMLRAGGRRLEALASRIGQYDGRVDEADEAMTRLRTSLLALNARVDAEAEEARRVATALLERIAADRHPGEPT